MRAARLRKSGTQTRKNPLDRQDDNDLPSADGPFPAFRLSCRCRTCGVLSYARLAADRRTQNAAPTITTLSMYVRWLPVCLLWIPDRGWSWYCALHLHPIEVLTVRGDVHVEFNNCGCVCALPHSSPLLLSAQPSFRAHCRIRQLGPI